ncbi:hypothetical protein JB92DRAFT_1947210 [Gautieria morchelliformis]|nr:hypothetical protein JB92DRAFT_1947210 [Gautieria morchelliformis]
MNSVMLRESRGAGDKENALVLCTAVPTLPRLASPRRPPAPALAWSLHRVFLVFCLALSSCSLYEIFRILHPSIFDPSLLHSFLFLQVLSADNVDLQQSFPFLIRPISSRTAALLPGHISRLAWLWPGWAPVSSDNNQQYRNSVDMKVNLTPLAGNSTSSLCCPPTASRHRRAQARDIQPGTTAPSPPLFELSCSTRRLTVVSGGTRSGSCQLIMHDVCGSSGPTVQQCIASYLEFDGRDGYACGPEMGANVSRFDDLELVIKQWVEGMKPQGVILSDALICSKAKEEAR